jgi:hypothetical protein
MISVKVRDHKKLYDVTMLAALISRLDEQSALDVGRRALMHEQQWGREPVPTSLSLT